MKLTVGPLPPAVYWRRRVAVAGILLFLFMITLIYSCSSNPNGSQRNRMQQPSGGPSPSLSPAVSLSPSPSVFTPGGGIVAQTGEGGEPPSPPVSPSAPPTGPCTDGEMTVTATPAQGSVPTNAHVRFYLRIKNISERSCTRDVGADAQELYLQNASKGRIWSSDTCEPRHGTDVRTFGPGIEAEFFLDWDGKASNAGCANRKPPPDGKYELVGRLATKLSDPAAVEVK